MYELIRQLCAEKGLSATKLCLDITGNSGYLAVWKKGHIRADHLCKLADILEVSTDYLLGRSNNLCISDNCNDNDRVLITYSTDNLDKFQKELLQEFDKLTLNDKGLILTKISKMLDKYNSKTK